VFGIAAWISLVLFYISKDESSALHASQRSENRYVTFLSFFLSFMLLFVAQDSPLLLPTDATGVSAGLALVAVSSFSTHFLHKRRHKKALKKVSSIPKNASYRAITSSLETKELAETVEDLVARLEKSADGIFAMRGGGSEEDVEQEVSYLPYDYFFGFLDSLI
jgi:hypothetical protein